MQVRDSWPRSVRWILWQRNWVWIQSNHENTRR